MKKLAIALSAVTLAALLAGPMAFAQRPPTTRNRVTPIQLKPTSNAPITLHMTDDSKNIYLAIGKMAGLNVLFDPDYNPKHVQVDINNAPLTDALRIVGELTGTFYKPEDSNTIFVAQNSRQKHADFDDLADETFYLKNAVYQSDANEVVTALRNILPAESKVFLVANENAIVVRTTPELLGVTQTLLNDLDRPKKAYRLTYTVTEMDGTRRVGIQHFAMVVVSGQQSTLKQGSRVPIATGSYNATVTAGANPAPAGVQTQFTYLDIGMNFDATLTALENGALLKSSIEQSSLAPETSGVGPQDPVVRQTSLKGMFYLTPNKPLNLGAVDIPGSTRHLDVEVVMEPLS
jgi:type II secretory pathway component GspD/PulD (secretin)